MKLTQRYLQEVILQDALKDQKIAFVSGPRQVGKTSMAENILKSQIGNLDSYFSWDDDEFRKIWIKNPKAIFEGRSLLVLDEIHKDRQWKNRLKGMYDQYKNKIKMIVTGSARLDFYRKSGDSLQGRYYPYRLHPFSLNETQHIPPPPIKEWDGSLQTKYKFESLLELGGFPDPFFGQSENKAQRWRRLYRERMIREDLRDLKEVRDVEQLKTLSLFLEDTVGSQLSYESLRQDLKVSFDTVRSWIELLEAVYFCYRIRPYSKGIKQAIRKEPKLYLFDWGALKDTGARFENLIASHLLKSCHAWSDSAMGEFELHYVRDKQKREVDFLVTQNQKPWLLVECKSGRDQITPALIHYTEKLKPTFSIQVVNGIAKERRSMAHPKIRVMDVRRFLSRLV
ncbi:MAG: ATP-binding protein [Proteobacteria bacterium]|nr:ATP-binding protein [Pseudomonadota bacterium]